MARHAGPALAPPCGWPRPRHWSCRRRAPPVRLRRRPWPGASPSTRRDDAGSRGPGDARTSRRRASRRRPAVRPGSCAATPWSRPSGTPRPCPGRGGGGPWESRRPPPRPAWPSRPASTSGTGGRSGRCRSGSAARAGRGGWGRSGRSADRGRRCSPGRIPRPPPCRPPAVSSSDPRRPTRARRRSTSRRRGGPGRADRRSPSGAWDRRGYRPARPPSTSGKRASSFSPGTGSQLEPPSSDRKSPCGEVPAYQEPGFDGWPGVSQKVWSTTLPFSPLRAFGKAGGRAASFQVRPRSTERKMVGPRCPVLAAASSVRPSRGSRTRWWITWPRKCGPSSRHRRRAASPRRSHAPFRVATRTIGSPGRAGIFVRFRVAIRAPPGPR